jgi:hypothetical protein
MAWIDAQDGVSSMLCADNDPEWLSIIRDATFGANVRAAIYATWGDVDTYACVRTAAARAHGKGATLAG